MKLGKRSMKGHNPIMKLPVDSSSRRKSIIIFQIS